MPIDFKKVKLLIVDMDNTLVDTFHTYSKRQWSHVAQSFRKRGLEKYALALDKNFGHGFIHTLQSTGISKKDLLWAIKVYDKVPLRGIKLYGDAHEILGVPMKKVLMSRGEPRLQKRKIRELKLRKHFDEIHIVDTFHTKKAAMQDILRRHGLKPKEVIILGDRIEEEIADGKSLGIPTVLVRRPGWPVKTSRIKPDMTVRKLGTVAKQFNTPR